MPMCRSDTKTPSGVGAHAVSRAFLLPAGRVLSHTAPGDLVRRATVASDGVVVHALELPAPSGARTIVHFHNSRETAEAGADVARASRVKLGVLLVEYRGYGASRGE
jgi:hypothetical protein